MFNILGDNNISPLFLLQLFLDKYIVDCNWDIQFSDEISFYQMVIMINMNYNNSFVIIHQGTPFSGCLFADVNAHFPGLEK